ncbi:MAG: surfactin synthase thioesterase subunit [Cognaticolwellia sp.]|jgi:medium-chain acyl-[acyl-carrier-protein] hydrolase
MSQNKWFVIPKPNPTAKLRFFCFPYAGGSAATYIGWVNQLPENVEMVIVQPPGRGSRMFEPLYTQMDTLVSELACLIPSYLNKPFIFYGHSLGSRVAFELMNQLKKRQLPIPIHFIASGSKGPHNVSSKKPVYQLPESEFINELKQLSGTPIAVLENSELMELFLPLLRADFEIAYTYSYIGCAIFECPITVLGGDNDIEITHEHLASWEHFFKGKADVHLIVGNHFFIDSNKEAVLVHVNKVLEDTTSSQLRF